MSRIGRLPVVIPQGVTVTFTDGVATVKGPLGTLRKKSKVISTLKSRETKQSLQETTKKKKPKRCTACTGQPFTIWWKALPKVLKNTL